MSDEVGSIYLAASRYAAYLAENTDRPEIFAYPRSERPMTDDGSAGEERTMAHVDEQLAHDE